MMPIPPLSTDHASVVSISLAHLDRLLAIQSAAREFRKLTHNNPAMLLPGCRRYLDETLFALLDAATVG